MEKVFSISIYEQGLYPEHGSCGRSTKPGEGQYGTKLIVVDDAHDLSLQHLMFLKEVTDQGRLQYNHRLGLCLVAAGRGQTIPLKEILDQPETMWLQFRRRMDKLEPFCRITGHTSEEVREVLTTLETPYRELFPQLNLRQWSGIIYTWLTHSLLDPTNSGRATMDNLMKLVTTALEWTYEAGQTDVQEETLERAAELLMLRHDTFRIIEGSGPSVDVQDESSTSPAQTEPGNAKKESQALSPTLSQLSDHTGEQSQKQPASQPKCAFFGEVPIDLEQFLESGVFLVQCPDCTSTSALSPHKGILHFKPHKRRKRRSTSTEPRWVRREMIWVVVSG